VVETGGFLEALFGRLNALFHHYRDRDVLDPSIGEGAPIQVMCLGQLAMIVGTPEGDDLTGIAGSDVIAGLGGNDWIYAV
jgi:hypothetical protein